MIRFGRWGQTALIVIGLVSWCGSAEAKPNLGKQLLEAALQGESTKLQELLSLGEDPNHADKEGCTPLIVAAGGCSIAVSIAAKGQITSTATESRGTVEMVRALLAAGAKPDVVKNCGTSALMAAARFGHTESVRALLDAHADPNLADAKSRVALHWAASEGHAQVVSVLVLGGATVDSRTSAQATQLGLAVGAGNLEVTRVLLAAGADVKAVDTKGQAAAAAWLLERGAAVNARDNEGETPLSYARKRGHLDVAALLEKKGATE